MSCLKCDEPGTTKMVANNKGLEIVYYICTRCLTDKCVRCEKKGRVEQDPFVIVITEDGVNITYDLCDTCYSEQSDNPCSMCDYCVDGPWNTFVLINKKFFCKYCVENKDIPDCNKKSNYDSDGFYKLNHQYKIRRQSKKL